MPKNHRATAKVSLIAGLALSACGWAGATHADDLKSLGNIGDAHKASGLITSYQIRSDTRSLDLIAATPRGGIISDKVERQVAGKTAREICATGAGRVSGSWTVRIFLPGESSPAAACRIGGHRAAAPSAPPAQ